MKAIVTLKTIDSRKSIFSGISTPVPTISQVFSKAINTLYHWQERSRQRHALRELDDNYLNDMGIDKAEASRESRKPFWKK